MEATLWTDEQVLDLCPVAFVAALRARGRQILIARFHSSLLARPMAQCGAGIAHAEAQDLDAGYERLVDVDPRRCEAVVGASVVSHAKR